MPRIRYLTRTSLHGKECWREGPSWCSRRGGGGGAGGGGGGGVCGVAVNSKKVLT